MTEMIPNMEEILAQMRDSFLDTAQEKIDRLNEILQSFRNGQGADQDLIEEFRREVHSLKGMGGTFQMGLVTKLCHQFETYMDGSMEFSDELIDASQIYIDRLSDLIASDEASNETLLSKWLDGLPQKCVDVQEPDLNDQKIVVIATENKKTSEIVSQSFKENDYVTLVTYDPFEAFKLAVLNKSCIIVVDQKFDTMSGAELLRSIEAQKKFTHAKLAMICPDRRDALSEELVGVHLLSEKNIEVDILNFLALAITA